MSETKLREALRQIEEAEPAAGEWDGWRVARLMRDIARTALASIPAEPEQADEVAGLDVEDCPECGDWRDSPTADCAACGLAPARDDTSGGAS